MTGDPWTPAELEYEVGRLRHEYGGRLGLLARLELLHLRLADRDGYRLCWAAWDVIRREDGQ